MASTERYLRQMILPGMGQEGQHKLADSTVGVMGVGGLGSPVSTYLAGAGVGRLILADPQVPDMTNLNRQIMHWEEDVGKVSKPASAAWKLKRFNPQVEVEVHQVEVTPDNIAEVFRGADVIIDCLDSIPPRLVLNDHALQTSTPFVHAAVEGLHGQITVIDKGTPCLRCLFPRVPERKRMFPILGPTAGVFGCLEAAEAIKLLTGIGQPLRSRLLIGDLEHNSWETIEIFPADNCPACGKRR
ncbi:MAG: HesA/MoeB/ThiF family protein [Methanomassiliicoccus sp.]|nr:HesA/MoeB/ThiF family protein [Methanomassiliicoccus sp.]